MLWVLKRSGTREPFDREKLIAGARSACKNRPVAPDELERLASNVEAVAWSLGPEVPSDAIGRAVLEQLRELDEVAAVRFASVYKGFEQVDDFARELGLLQPPDDPKAHPSRRSGGARRAGHVDEDGRP